MRTGNVGRRDTILAHEQEAPEATLAEGPVLDIVRNVDQGSGNHRRQD